MNKVENAEVDSVYTDNLKFFSSLDAPQGDLKLLSARDMFDACEAFLCVTRSYIDERRPRLISDRSALARLIETSFPRAWKPHEEWKGRVQLALENTRRRFEKSHISALDEWQTWEELETDIHISVQCSRKTVELFSSGDAQFLPMPTSVFLVPARMDLFLCSLISGHITPTWAGTVDAALTPGCCFGIYPKYAPRKV
ncbi:hypothetical protein ACLEC1_14710 [Lonsdalea quercina]|uniref:hypothetical protein n=1 Tax=Lonsdalea quercina TaxID=71657 RepID=UPI0039765A7E